jgi:hypothetical protein
MVQSGPARGAIDARRSSSKARLGVEPFRAGCGVAQDSFVSAVEQRVAADEAGLRMAPRR